MELTHWLSLFGICLLGAMSPGPSLAVVMQATLQGGRLDGFRAAISHGAGVGLYGLLTVSGLTLLIAEYPGFFLFLQLLGAAYLVYLGWGSLRRREDEQSARGRNIARNPGLSGFLVAFLNPKLAIFMLALFSQFLRPGGAAAEKAIMVATVGLTDAAWYCAIAMAVSHPTLLAQLERRSDLIDSVFGVLLIVLALTVLVRVLLAV